VPPSIPNTGIHVREVYLEEAKDATCSIHIFIVENRTTMQPNVLGTPTGIAVEELNQLEDRRMSFRGGKALPNGNLMVYIPT